MGREKFVLCPQTDKIKNMELTLDKSEPKPKNVGKKKMQTSFNAPDDSGGSSDSTTGRQDSADPVPPPRALTDTPRSPSIGHRAASAVGAADIYEWLKKRYGRVVAILVVVVIVVVGSGGSFIYWTTSKAQGSK